MSSNNSIGNDTPRERRDANQNAVADTAERAFAESSEVQKTPHEPVPDRAAKNVESHGPRGTPQGRSERD